MAWTLCDGLTPPFEQNDVLYCHSVNGSAIYPLGTAACDLTMDDAVPRPSSTSLRVFPNPAIERLAGAGAAGEKAPPPRQWPLATGPRPGTPAARAAPVAPIE